MAKKSEGISSPVPADNFPGASQLDDLWRWIERLPADKTNAVSPAVLADRRVRLERVEALRDRGNYASPELKGQVKFAYLEFQDYAVGQGEHQFKIMFSAYDARGVRVYRDSNLHGIGLLPPKAVAREKLGDYLKGRRQVAASIGESVLLQNTAGLLCIIKILAVQEEVNADPLISAEVTFSYEIFADL